MPDRWDGLWHDADVVGWYPRDGRPGLSPALSATVCVLQFVLGLTETRSGSSAVKSRRTKSAAAGRLPGLVSDRRLRIFRPAKPSSVVTFATVFTATRQPLRICSVNTLGEP